MQYRKFKDENISLLSLGCMRLPLKAEEGKAPTPGMIDKEKTAEMIDFAIKNGINYFDTALPYHDSLSETVVGEILSRYPRESFYLADKYPGHQPVKEYKPAETFETQLKKCRVEYFDFYLLHNVCEFSYGVYTDEKIGILGYFLEQKRLGRIKHLGFSSHGRPENLKAFLDYCSDYVLRHPEYAESAAGGSPEKDLHIVNPMEFCQIQMNYLDWDFQDAKSKYDILEKYNIPVWVMEPVRGGNLASFKGDEVLKKLRPDSSVASWTFRWLMQFPYITTILSGMSDMEQLKDNIDTVRKAEPISEEENRLLYRLAANLYDNVPCTSCGYCLKSCPLGLDIPALIHDYNEIKGKGGLTPIMHIESLPAGKQPSSCIGCGKCASQCPQKIDIPAILASLSDIFSSSKKWTEISAERERISKRNSN